MYPTLVDLPGTGTPVWVIHGWGGGPIGYRVLMQELNAKGNRVLMLPSLRRGGTAQLPEHTRYRTLGIQAEYQLQAIEHIGLNKVILLGHSMGGAVAQLVGGVLHNQNKRVRVICLCSACVHRDNPLSLGARLLWKSWRDRQPTKHLPQEEQLYWRQVQREALAYLLGNKARSFAEGWALGLHAARIFAAQPSGLETYYVAGARDRLFTPARVRRAVAHLPVGRYLEVNIPHDPQFRSENSRAVVEALDERGLLRL